MPKSWCSDCGESFHGYVLCDHCEEKKQRTPSYSYNDDTLNDKIKELEAENEELTLCNGILMDKSKQDKKLIADLQTALEAEKERVQSLMERIDAYFDGEKRALLGEY